MAFLPSNPRTFGKVILFTLLSLLATPLSASPVQPITSPHTSISRGSTTSSSAATLSSASAPVHQSMTPVTCRKNKDPKYCTVTADFIPDGRYNNVFNVYDHNCNLDTSSHKSINPDPHNLDRSVHGTPMKYSFDVVEFLDPKGKHQDLRPGFIFNYGSKYKNIAISWVADPSNPDYIPQMAPKKQEQLGLSWYSGPCRNLYDLNINSECYSVQFICQN